MIILQFPCYNIYVVFNYEYNINGVFDIYFGTLLATFYIEHIGI